MNISKIDSSFVVFDELKEKPLFFDNFAVQQRVVSDLVYTTDRNKRGIHVLMYKRRVEDDAFFSVEDMNFSQQDFSFGPEINVINLEEMDIDYQRNDSYLLNSSNTCEIQSPTA